MNKQLKKLFEEAGANENTLAIVKSKTYFDPEKFAELIIRECAELATEEYNNRSAIHGDDLLFHFGVR